MKANFFLLFPPPASSFFSPVPADTLGLNSTSYHVVSLGANTMQDSGLISASGADVSPANSLLRGKADPIVYAS